MLAVLMESLGPDSSEVQGRHYDVADLLSHLLGDWRLLDHSPHPLLHQQLQRCGPHHSN